MRAALVIVGVVVVVALTAIGVVGAILIHRGRGQRADPIGPAVIDAGRPDAIPAPPDADDSLASRPPLVELVDMVAHVVAGDRGDCKAMRFDLDALLAANRLTLDRTSLRELPRADASAVTTQLDALAADAAACRIDLSALRR